MYGDTALQLLRELKRCTWLPPSRDELLRKVAAEIVALDKLLCDALQQSQSDGEPETSKSDLSSAAPLLLHWHAILRNKRCALAYLNERIQRIESLWWAMGSAAALPEEVDEATSQAEKHFLTKYDDLIGEYMGSVDMDLHMDTEPPKGLYIECRVLKNSGKVQTDSGVFTLEENSTVFMKRKDAELLVRQGILQHIG